MLLMGAGCGTPAYMTAPSAQPTAAPQAAADPAKQIAFQVAMHRLWEDHITWTRLYLVGAAENLEGTDLVAARLLKNQEDIGAAIKPYYGAEAGDKLTALLKEHITGAVAIVTAAKAKDAAKTNAAVEAWRKNGDDIATFLSSANPDNWPLQTMKDTMRGHLDITLTEAQDLLGDKYADSIKDYDAAKSHIYMMADVLAGGIIKQFPDKF